MKKINQIELDKFIQNHNLYLKEITNVNKKGKRLVINEVDFTDNDLSKLDFVETYITNSLFKSKVFEDVNFGGAELYDCIFEDVIFRNCNFGKTVFNYTQIMQSKFLNCNLIELETIETCFEKLIFQNCDINGAFSDCIVKNVRFEECVFYSTEFWQCILEKLTFFSRKKILDVKKIIKELNIGTIENPILINGQEAIKYFENKCTIEYNI